MSIIQKINNLPNEFEVGRYHSWVISNENLPADLVVTSTDENGQIMSMKHTHFDIRGVQYHPESVLTPYGKKILENWREIHPLDPLMMTLHVNTHEILIC